MARNPKNTGTPSGPPPLEGDLLERYNELKEELKYYQDIKNKVWARRKKIKQILDNFNRVITEDVIADIADYRLSENQIDSVIDNSVILSEQDIRDKIDESDYDNSTIGDLKTALGKVFELDEITKIINASDELGDSEMYSRIVASLVQLVEDDEEILEAFRSIIESIEDDLL
jgi:predicted nuclease of restriction endonuclease-like (RecB) superfamily